MFFAVAFSLVGNEIKISQGTSKSSTNGVSEGGKILIGGVAATVVLTMLSHAGEAGAEFATGLALITTVTSVLVFGGPVWLSLSKAVGTKSLTPTTPTAATKPTTGTATAVALAQAA